MCVARIWCGDCRARACRFTCATWEKAVDGARGWASHQNIYQTDEDGFFPNAAQSGPRARDQRTMLLYGPGAGARKPRNHVRHKRGVAARRVRRYAGHGGRRRRTGGAATQTIAAPRGGGVGGRHSLAGSVAALRHRAGGRSEQARHRRGCRPARASAATIKIIRNCTLP